MDAVPISKKIVAFGSKQVFLPKFTIALVRTPRLSPYHARFLVPLNFSKYDLRDYLYHAYAVKCHSIRSFVKQMPVRDTRQQPRHWFRPESKKYMTVEMEKPFVWPEDPESWEPWGREEKEKALKETVTKSGVESAEDKRNAGWHLKNQAREMLGWVEKSAEAGVGLKGKGGKKAEKKQSGKPDLLKQWEEKRSPQMLGRRYA